MAVEPKYEIVNGQVIRHTTVAGQDITDTRAAADFVARMQSTATYDTGLLPQHVRAVFRDERYVRLVLNIPPEFHVVSNGHRGPRKYNVAMPWRVAIVDFMKHEEPKKPTAEPSYFLYGARIFYAPEQTINFDQPLYHTNLPNINCMGYGGRGAEVSVGWVCFYHNAREKLKTVEEMAQRAIFRLSGDEEYNDNMRSIDGSAFYGRQTGKLCSTLADFQRWETYTEKHGLEWVVDPAAWVPVLTDANQHKHIKNSSQLTLKDCLYTNRPRMYYHDDRVRGWYREVTPDPMAAVKKAFLVAQTEDQALKAQHEAMTAALSAKLAKKIKPAPELAEGQKIVGSAEFGTAKITFDPVEEVIPEAPLCTDCNSPLSGDTFIIEGIGPDNNKTIICTSCYENESLVTCGTCYRIWHHGYGPIFYTVFPSEEEMCTECVTARSDALGTCDNCEKLWDLSESSAFEEGCCSECQ